MLPKIPILVLKIEGLTGTVLYVIYANQAIFTLQTYLPFNFHHHASKNSI